MIFNFWRPAEKRLHRRRKTVPHDLSAQQMRDIGLEPWPERPNIPAPHLW